MLTRREALALPLVSLLPEGLHPRLAQAADEATPMRVFPKGDTAYDVRLMPRTLNGYFPFHVPTTKEAWEARKKIVREDVLVANGLWPLPEKTPLNPVIHGKIERDGYTIEKVFFASTPGHYVCGNLYRPAQASGGSNPPGSKLPGVLFAHGHWKNGRFELMNDKEIESSVKSRGEPDAERAKYFMQAIPTNLARLGFVVFQYDMVGYADSTAIKHTDGFRDAVAELRLQSFMGLQTWNSLRALDFLESLPDVDPKRLGMTGASGGGTQTFITGAIDDRLAAAFPAVMVSTGMQGGCVCENCSLLRIDTGNVELAGMMAPKPLAMSAAKDWTHELMTKGYPELQKLYDLYDARDKVEAMAWLEFGHQYNVHARQMMYGFFLKHLKAADKFQKEQAYKPTEPKDLSVFDAAHPRPKGELDAPQLRAALTKASDEQLATLTPKDAAGLKEFKRVVGTALRAMCDREPPLGRDGQFPLNRRIEYTMKGDKFELDFPGGVRGNLGLVVHSVHPNAPREEHDDTHPGQKMYAFLHLLPKNPNRRTVLWVHPRGKASLFDGDKPAAGVRALLDAGIGVLGIDVHQTGEMVGKPLFAPRAKNDYAGYVYGYNSSVLANRVRDVFAAAHQLQNRRVGYLPMDLVGWGEMGVVAILAKALAGHTVAKTAADLNQFRFENVKDIADPMMLPGAVKYGGLPAFLALCAPGEVLVHNHKGTNTGKLSKAAYDAAGAPTKITRVDEKLDDAKVVEWLIK